MNSTKKLHSEENEIFLEGDCDTYSENKGKEIQGNETLGKEESEQQQSPIHQQDKKVRPQLACQKWTQLLYGHILSTPNKEGNKQL